MSGLEQAALMALVACAVVLDGVTRRVPNTLTVPGLGLALALHLGSGGWVGLGEAAAGAALGGGALILPWKLGAVGGGDVKLMAAAGAFLGPVGALWALGLGGVAVGAVSLILAVRAAWRAGTLPLLAIRPQALVPPGLTFAMAVPLALGILGAAWRVG